MREWSQPPDGWPVRTACASVGSRAVGPSLRHNDLRTHWTTVAPGVDRDGYRAGTSSISRLPVNKVAWFIVVLIGLTAVSSILASVLGAQATLLAVVSTIFTGVAGLWAGQLQGKERARALERQQAAELQRRRKQEEYRQWSIRQGLDHDCAELLRRAEIAVNAIVGSDAHASDLLDPPVDEKLLRDCIQRILLAGAKITDLRARQRAIAIKSLPKSEQPSRRYERDERTPGPMTGAVLEPQQQALAMVLRSMTSHAENLERYASSIKKVDASYRDWMGSQEAGSLNDSVRDVLAEMVQDKLAVEELNRLAERTSLAEEAFRQSIQEAHLAAETLALPEQNDTTDSR